MQSGVIVAYPARSSGSGLREATLRLARILSPSDAIRRVVGRANTWQGSFPALDQGDDGYRGVAPVGCFPGNARGLYDMVGNVWEWTTDWYSDAVAPATAADAKRADPEKVGKRVIKGGCIFVRRTFASAIAAVRVSLRMPRSVRHMSAFAPYARSRRLQPKIFHSDDRTSW
jgi:hypothetical protein